jgi:hypothetical protein
VDVKTGCLGDGTFFRFADFFNLRPARQALPGISRFVHHAIIQAHDKDTAVARAYAVRRTKLFNQGAETVGDVSGNVGQPSGRA